MATRKTILDKRPQVGQKSCVRDHPNLSQSDPFLVDELPPVQQQATTWFVRLRSEYCTAAEREAFNHWLQAGADHQKEYAAVAALWDELDGLEIKAAPRSPFRRGLANRWAAAAGVLLAMGVAGYSALISGTHRTAKGKIESIVLGDGSVAYLNTDTVVSVAMTEAERTLSIRRGEALVDVAADPRPFTVLAGDVKIRDIGTRFDVKREEGAITIAVAEGEVEIQGAGTPCLLTAGFTTRLNPSGSCGAAEPFDAARALAWREGKLIFDATPLAEVVETFNRYQDEPLRIADPEAARLTLSGVFRIANLDQIPALLPLTLPVSVEETDDGFSVHSTPYTP